MKKLKELWFTLPDIYRRAIKTFIQCMMASLCGSLYKALTEGNVAWNGALIKSIILGAIASGLSGLMNFIYQIQNQEKEVKQE